MYIYIAYTIISKIRNYLHRITRNPKPYKHVKSNCSPYVCKKLTWIGKYCFEFYYKREINLHRIARNPRSATKSSMLIKLTGMLKVTVFHIYAKK